MKKKSILENNTALKIFSLIIAIVGWVFVVVVVNPEFTAEVKDLPVQIRLSDSTMEKLGLELVSDQIVLANVTVTGARTQVGSLGTNDIEVYAVPTGISEPGTYSDIQIQARNISNGKTFVINQCTPSTITLTFDRTTSKTFSVVPQFDDLQVAEGYLSQETILSPSSITVSGPEKDINAIAKCVVYGENLNNLTGRTTFNSPVILLDAQGNEIKNTHLSLSTNMVDITIPVLLKKELPIKLTYQNAPVGFVPDSLPYELSNTSIEVAGPENVLQQYPYIELQHIDLSDLNDSRDFDLEVRLPSTFVNIDNITTIIVRFNLNEYEERVFENVRVEMTNPPENYDVNLENKTISRVKLFGPREVLDTISPEQVYATLALNNNETKRGSYSVRVQVSVDGQSSVWALGEYTVVIDVKEKTPED